MLCSLGTGLNGGFGSDVCEDDGSSDAGPAAPLNPRSPEVDFFLGLDFDLADMGSRVRGQFTKTTILNLEQGWEVSPLVRLELAVSFERTCRRYSVR